VYDNYEPMLYMTENVPLAKMKISELCKQRNLTAKDLSYLYHAKL
jgi:hypothetical protein